MGLILPGRGGSRTRRGRDIQHKRSSTRPMTMSVQVDGISQYLTKYSTTVWGDFGFNGSGASAHPPWTMAIWFKTPTTGVIQTLIAWEDHSGGTWSRILLGNAPAGSSYSVAYQCTNSAFDGTTGPGIGATGSYPYVACAIGTHPVVGNGWHQIVITSEGVPSTGQVKLYLDGALVDSGTQKTGIMDPDRYFYVSEGPGTLLYGGNVAQIGMWSGTEFSAAQVTALYNSGSGIDLAPLGPTVYYKMGNDPADTVGVGGTIIDNGSAGLDLDVINTALIVSDAPP